MNYAIDKHEIHCKPNALQVNARRCNFPGLLLCMMASLVPQEKRLGLSLMRRVAKMQPSFPFFAFSSFLPFCSESRARSHSSSHPLSISLHPFCLVPSFVFLSCLCLLIVSSPPASVLRHPLSGFSQGPLPSFFPFSSSLSGFFLVSHSPPTLHILYILYIHHLSRTNSFPFFSSSHPPILLAKWPIPDRAP